MVGPSHWGGGMTPLDSVSHPSKVSAGLLRVYEEDARGEPVPLAAEPGAVRVSVVTEVGTSAVTVAPLAGVARGRVAMLREPTAPAGSRALPLLAYVALQRARVWRCSVVATDEAALLAGPLDMTLGAGGMPAQSLDLAMHRLFQALGPGERACVAGRFVAEALAALDRRAREFADNAWCRAVREERLTRVQYVAALANTHQYVRYTPRLLARAIAASEDAALREHFFRHLRGERGHERLIEADLRYLGADVAFVVGAMVPSPATLAFMVLQESMIGVHQDPLRFLAAPFVAEGLAARIEPEFLVRLAANIRRWGYSEPAKATRFLASHAHVDGGEDGHFAGTVAVLARLLRDDTAQQRFLAVLHLAADTFTRSYDDHAEEFDLSTGA